MIRSLLRPIALALAFVVPTFAETPVFVVYPDGINLAETARSLEGSGVRVRQRVPPRILIADLPAGRGPATLGAQNAYTGAVPLGVLEPLGPVSVAAGVHWNRRAVSAAVQGNGLMSAGAMRQLVATRSLPTPTGLVLSPSSDRVTASWDALDGASFYEVEASLDPTFETVAVRTNVVDASAQIALPDAPGAYHVRVRGADRGSAAGDDDDVRGAWTQATTVDIAAVPMNAGGAPTLTSPADNLETAGFTLILEWTGAGSSRVQVSRASDFSTTIFDDIVDVNEKACLQQAMNTGDRLFWRVRSEGPARGDWSSSRRVRIGAARNEHVDAFINPEAPQ